MSPLGSSGTRLRENKSSRADPGQQTLRSGRIPTSGPIDNGACFPLVASVCPRRTRSTKAQVPVRPQRRRGVPVEARELDSGALHSFTVAFRSARLAGRVLAFAAGPAVKSEQAAGRFDGDRCLAGRSDVLGQRAAARERPARSRRLLNCQRDPAGSRSR
jgi:hypothetical protein